jgi:hypothetical protein
VPRGASVSALPRADPCHWRANNPGHCGALQACQCHHAEHADSASGVGPTASKLVILDWFARTSKSSSHSSSPRVDLWS